MNLLANKTLVQTEWIALDGGILISWLSFMCMDIITKHFGPKASNKIAFPSSKTKGLRFIPTVLLPIISSASSFSFVSNVNAGSEAKIVFDFNNNR